ncbi:MAG: hypothetical protein IJ874_06365 [Ruminococcus sp.]|nr:hypothetical protein [Ruminococcus sp.]
MTKYLTEYMADIAARLGSCPDMDTLDELIAEHRDKIAFMQHERIVHFLVTMLFALVLAVFIIGLLVTENIFLLLLVTIILVLLAFYIKHYYFLENTVQQMYRVYDDMLGKRRSFAEISKGGGSVGD